MSIFFVLPNTEVVGIFSRRERIHRERIMRLISVKFFVVDIELMLNLKNHYKNSLKWISGFPLSVFFSGIVALPVYWI